jgi:hypothetical protein
MAYSRVALLDTLDDPEVSDGKVFWKVPVERRREFDNRLYFPCSLSVFVPGKLGIEVNGEGMYIGEGKFKLGDFVVRYSSRRPVIGGIEFIRQTLREEFAWLGGVEVEMSLLEEMRSENAADVYGEEEDEPVGSGRDDSARDLRRQLRPEMYI